MFALLQSGQIGETDCETIGAGLLAQPANAISSLAYLVAGAWLALAVVRSNSGEQRIAIVYGIALALVGMGSVAFHGPMPPGARFLHDLTIASLFVIVAARGVGDLRSWAASTTLVVAGAVTALIGVVMAVAPDVGIAMGGIVGVGALGLEAYLFRSGRRPPLGLTARRWLVTGAVLLAAGGLVNLLGRTGGPLCDPETILQGHAGWHLLTAAAFGIYGVVSFQLGSPTEDGG